MQYNWLNRQNNKNLIIFFAGWSFDSKPFEYLKCEDNDVLVFYDYTELDNIPDIEQYDTYTLITWSMGVYVAYLLKDKLPKFNKKIAINGTVYPVDNQFGIPHKTFELTLKYAETGLQGKFYKNVFSNDSWYERYMQNPVQRSLKSRVDELIALDNFIKTQNIVYDNKFYDKALVGLSDKIIPTKNQLAFWKEKAQTIDCGHFPFYNYSSWNEICK